MTRPIVGAIVVSYGPAAPARRAVQSLMEAGLAPDYALVINNGPSRIDDWVGPHRLEPGNLRAGDRPDRGVTIIEATRNLGYSGGLRLGMSALSGGSSVDFAWFLNNDIVVDGGALDALLCASASDASVGLWGSTLCVDDSFTTVATAGARYSKWTTRRRPVLAGLPTAHVWAASFEPRVDFVIGAAMFMPSFAYRRCGGLSADYFMYYEELDLAARLRNVGLSVGWCRDAFVAHRGGLTTGSEQDRRSRPPAVAFHSMRSALLYTRRHSPAAVPAVIVSRTLRHVLVEAVRGNCCAARAAAQGCLAGLTDQPWEREPS